MKKFIYSFIAIAIVAFTLYGSTSFIHSALAESKEAALARAQAAYKASVDKVAQAAQLRDDAQKAVDKCTTSVFCSSEQAALTSAQQNYDQALAAQRIIVTEEKAIQKTSNDANGNDAQATNQANLAEKQVGITSQAANGGFTNTGTITPMCTSPLSPNFSIEECFKTAASWMAYTLIVVTSWLVALTGILLDAAIQYSVVGMAANISHVGAINIGWSIIRDLGNLVFIFALLYIAVTTILNISGPQTKTLIRNLIIIGLLVNFSLFFTKVLIDASNLISLTVYSQFTQNVDGSKGISSQIKSMVGLDDVMDPTAAKNAIQSKDWTGILTTGIGGSIFILCVALTFLYAAVLFLIRFVILILLMMLSPIGFFAYLLPSFNKWGEKWWTMLLSQLIFAPLYMIMIGLTFLVALGLQGTIPGATKLASVLVPTIQSPAVQNGIVGPIMNYIIIIALINAAAIIATSVATTTTGFISGMTNKASESLSRAGRYVARKTVDTSKAAVGTATFGTIGLAGRSTLGRFANSRLQKEGDDLKKKAAEGDVIAKRRLEKLESRATNSYDARTLKPIAKLGLGEAGGKGGYKAKFDAKKAKTEAKIYKRGKPTSETKKNIKTAQSSLNAAEQAYRDAVAKGAPESELKKLSKDVSDRKADLSRHKRTAAREIRDQRREYAAKLAQKGGIFTKDTARQAAGKDFVNKVLNAKKTPEEKVDDMIDKINTNISDPTKLATEIGKMKPSALKDLPGNVLEKPEVLEAVWKEHGSKGFSAILKNADKYSDSEVKAIIDHASTEGKLNNMGVGDFMELQKANVLEKLDATEKKILSDYVRNTAVNPGPQLPGQAQRTRDFANYINNKGKDYWK